ncbi:MAG: GNAT family N-acetyltransferase [Bacteroidota bacterium]
MGYLTIPLDSTHNKSLFSCGNSLLDNYLHKQAKQDVKKHLSACFVLLEGESIIGYYTLSSASIIRESVLENFRKKLPQSYNNIPTTLLGRLAVDKKYKGKGYGELLMIDALKRSFDASISIGSIAVIVDPIDEDAKAFYLKYGFILLPDSKKMFIAMDTISELF